MLKNSSKLAGIEIITIGLHKGERGLTKNIFLDSEDIEKLKTKKKESLILERLYQLKKKLSIARKKKPSNNNLLLRVKTGITIVIDVENMQHTYVTPGDGAGVYGAVLRFLKLLRSEQKWLDCYNKNPYIRGRILGPSNFTYKDFSHGNELDERRMRSIFIFLNDLGDK